MQKLETKIHHQNCNDNKNIVQGWIWENAKDKKVQSKELIEAVRPKDFIEKNLQFFELI